MSNLVNKYQSFWQNRWEKGEINFHLNSIHPDLKLYLSKLSLAPDSTIFVPLCGKTLDIGYLLSNGYRVIAAEMVEIAVKQLFEELQLTPNVSAWKEGLCYQSGALTVYVGNFFDLSVEDCAGVDAIYDRAALVAMPHKRQSEYCRHLGLITQHAKCLLSTLTFDQNTVEGPPFSISMEQLHRYYADRYTIECLKETETIDEEPTFQAKGLKSVIRRAFLLKSIVNE